MLLNVCVNVVDIVIGVVGVCIRSSIIIAVVIVTDTNGVTVIVNTVIVIIIIIIIIVLIIIVIIIVSIAVIGTVCDVLKIGHCLKSSAQLICI